MGSDDVIVTVAAVASSVAVVSFVTEAAVVTSAAVVSLATVATMLSSAAAVSLALAVSSAAVAAKMPSAVAYPPLPGWTAVFLFFRRMAFAFQLVSSPSGRPTMSLCVTWMVFVFSIDDPSSLGVSPAPTSGSGYTSVLTVGLV